MMKVWNGNITVFPAVFALAAALQLPAKDRMPPRALILPTNSFGKAMGHDEAMKYI